MSKDYLTKYQELLGLKADGVIGPITAKAIMDDIGIKDRVLFSHLFGQMRLESGGFSKFRENMNYSAKGLMSTFERYYKGKPELAEAHAHRPTTIANYVYANRNGNKGVESGDGYFYRGAFGLQTTGRANFLALFRELGLPADTDPDSLEEDVRTYFRAGLFYFNHNNVDTLCTGTSASCILSVGRKINLGTYRTETMPIHAELRQEYTKALFRSTGLST